MEKDDLKRVIESIQPDVFMQNRLRAKIKAPIKNKAFLRIAVSFVLVFMLLIGGLYGLPLLNGQDNIISTSDTSNNSTTSKTPASKNSFTLQAYAAGNPTANSTTPIDISQIPKRQLMMLRLLYLI